MTSPARSVSPPRGHGAASSPMHRRGLVNTFVPALPRRLVVLQHASREIRQLSGASPRPHPARCRRARRRQARRAGRARPRSRRVAPSSPKYAVDDLEARAIHSVASSTATALDAGTRASLKTISGFDFGATMDAWKWWRRSSCVAHGVVVHVRQPRCRAGARKCAVLA